MNPTKLLICSLKINKITCFILIANFLSSSFSLTVKGQSKTFVPNHLSKTRSEFISSIILTTSTLVINTKESNAFDGGVGGLGKTKPNTGVIFRDVSLSAPLVGSNGLVTSEIIAPDDSNSPIIVSFKAPWPILKTAGIESRDLSNPESAFVQVSECPKGVTSSDMLPTSFFKQSIFSQSGKYGMYGEPTDVRIKKYSSPDDSKSIPAIYSAKFSTLTPAMRESERSALISAKIIDNNVYMLVTGTSVPRFKSKEKTLIEVAESFRAITAPKSSLKSSAS